jgi:EAL domain-containing protein (putative c-di-GMP-specific phosphodiesterase class I)/DNA-binding NarL/FixJ family response regulator
MPLKPLNILLLEDDATTRAFMTAMLEGLGASGVQAAADGLDGLRLLDTPGPMPNVLICDLAMPGMDGIEFLRHVASRGFDGEIVLLSGVSTTILKSAERLATEHGLSLLGMLEKPVDLEQLTRILSRCSQRRAIPPTGGSLPTLALSELREGLAAGCVEVHYQPKVNLRTGQVIGVECLARWRHPLHGLLPAGAFVPLIEHHGLIDELTLAVFRQAVAQQRAWLDRGRALTFNINLSMDNLLRVDLPETLEAMSHSGGVSPQGIVLEMTESRLMRDLKVSLDVLIRLRLKGFGLSIDDFGTGYSTMEALKQLPFSELKIDRTFVNGADHDAAALAILKSSAGLGQALCLNVVAEGVETQRDWDIVAAANCHEAQGYFIARPQAADAFWHWLGDRETPTRKEFELSDKPRLLLVDDDVHMRRLTTALLEERFNIREAASGAEAVVAAASWNPDIVLLDVELDPGMDGYEACRRLKADPATASIPVVFVSAHDALQDRLKGYEAGGEDYVVKPFDGAELEAKLLRLLAIVSERTALREQASIASCTAMTAMTSMSELGALLESMKSFGACTDCRALAGAAITGLAAYGLHGTVQVRAAGEVVTRTGQGEASPLEASVIRHMASMERITQFKSRLAITYQSISLLVHDMPVDDQDRCGRLRDHLAMLAEGAQARAEAIAAAAEARRRGEALEVAARRVTAALATIDRAQRERQIATRLAVDDLQSRMQSAYASVAMTTTQEDFMNETLQAGLERLLGTQEDLSGLQGQLSSIVGELEGLGTAEPMTRE